MSSTVSNATSDIEQVMQTYNLSMYIVIITVGCIWNGTLLLMFARHKEIRTTANTMIFNLAVCDVVNLLIVAPVRYKYHYPHESPDNVNLCRSISVFQHWILCASALSVVALSIQRFCIAVPHRMWQLKVVNRNTTLLTVIYILFIWMISFLISLPFGLIWEIYQFMCGDYLDGFITNIMILVDFIYYCLLLPFLMFFFNLATARRLKKSIRNFVGGVNNSTRDLVRKRSANVVTVLSVLFLLTHLPYFIWCFYAYWTAANRKSTTSLISEYMSKHFLFLNSCFNPVALYMTSSTFRRLFNKYLCCSKNQEGVVSTA